MHIYIFRYIKESLGNKKKIHQNQQTVKTIQQKKKYFLKRKFSKNIKFIKFSKKTFF